MRPSGVTVMLPGAAASSATVSTATVGPVRAPAPGWSAGRWLRSQAIASARARSVPASAASAARAPMAAL